MKKLEKVFEKLLVVASVLLSVIAINYGSKLFYLSDGFQQKHQNGIRIVDYVQKKRADIYGEDSNIIPHPYLLYVNNPGYAAKGFVQHDSGGYRIVPQPERSGIARPIKILILGGSTSYSFPYVANPADSWPAVLQKLLGPRYEVINAGLSSATTAELLAGYMFRHRYLKPDIVIIHEGGNDVVAMLYGNYNPEYTHMRAQGSRPVAGRMDVLILKWGGWPARVIYAENWNSMPTVFSSVPFNAVLGGPTSETANEMASTSPTEGFERNLSLLTRNIREDGAIPVLFGFVQAQEKNLSRNRPDLVGREHAVVIGLDRNLEVMQQIARQQNLLYLDPAKFKTDENWFLDNCHLNETGEEAKAQFVLGELKTVLVNRKSN
jgi:lysophospholipase L1-like esterase